MKVALFHNQPVPPRHYGGTERVCAWLCQGLLEAGHEVTLLAPGVSPEEASFFSKGWQRTLGSIRVLTWDPRESATQFLHRKLPESVDLLHSMAPLGSELERALGVPVLTTIHGNGKPGEPFSKTSVFVSADHARRHGSNQFVWNGLDPEEFSWRGTGGRSGFAFLAKTSWKVKNLRGVARLCSRAGVPLAIAGGERPWSVRLQAALRRDWSWLGSVSGERKAEHLSRAQAFLFPVLWPEPFGLVIAEALFSGTPVLGTPVGSLPELVSPEVGRLVSWEQEAEWVELLRQVAQGDLSWDPERCRKYAEEHFHYRQMTLSYLELYRKLRSGELSS